MDWKLYIPLITFSIPTIIGIIAFIVKVTIMNRITAMEEQLQESLSDQQTRQLIADKIEPMKEDLHELKSQLDKLFDRLLNH